ncbi:MAG: hypothetical protein IKG84_06465 [Bacteroidales bacterium]|nr:hypothetical protein [Bacteroidales bacterium]
MDSVKQDRRAALLASVVLFLELRPFFAWSFIENSFVKLALLLVLSVIFFSHKRTITKKDIPYIVIFFLATFCYVFFGYTCGRMNFNGFLNSLTLFLLISLPLCKKPFGEAVFNSFAVLFSLLVGISLLAWIINQIIGLPQLGTLELVGQQRSYLHYPFFVIEMTDYAAVDVLRFSGPFDEPGVVGTYGALILAVSKFNFKDWRTITIFLAGIFSFSLFFYIVSLVYLLFYYIVVKKNVVMSFILIATLFIFYAATKDNPIFYEYIWKRTAWNEEAKTIEGDNRSNDSVDAYLKRIRGTYEYYVGTSDENWYNTVAGGGSATYKSIICMNGIIFFVLYVGFFILLGTSNKKAKSEALLYCIIVLANFYQRSSVYFPVTVFLYCAFAEDYVLYPRKLKRRSLIDQT